MFNLRLYSILRMELAELILAEHKVTKDSEITLNIYCLGIEITEKEFKEFCNSFERKGILKLTELTHYPLCTDYTFFINVPVLKKELNRLREKYPFRKDPFINKKATEYIAKNTAKVYTYEKFNNLLKMYGLPKEYWLYIHKNKFNDFYSTLDLLSYLNSSTTKNVLLKIVESLGHPSNFEFDVDKAESFQDELSLLIEVDGYCFYKHEVVKTNGEILDKIYKRIGSRKNDPLKKELLEVADQQQANPKIQKKNSPYTLIEDKWGYFKFYKQSERIKIGSINSRIFRLLQRLCDPNFGTHWGIDSVFDAIRLEKDNADTSLRTDHTKRSRIIDIITNTKKELQKNKKLQGKISYKFDGQKKMMWLE